MQGGQKCSICSTRVAASIFSAVPLRHIWDVCTIQANWLCLGRGQHKATQIFAQYDQKLPLVMQLLSNSLLSREQKCRLTTFLSLVAQRRDQVWAVERVPIQATNFFSNSGIKAGSQFICKLHSSRQKRKKVISFTNSMTSVWLH